MAAAKEDVKNVLSSASKLASYNMILQLSFRILTFILNAFTLHHISREALGVVNVRLVLLYSTILFLSREAFRRACLSKTPSKDGEKRHSTVFLAQWKQMINILWFILPIGVVISSMLTYIWINYLESPDPSLVPYYPIAAVLFALSALIELISEPLYVLSQALLFIKLRVFSEGISMILKCIITVLLVLAFPQIGILSFCISQILFSVTYTSIFYGYFVWYIISGQSKKQDNFPFTSIRQFFPDISGSKPFDADLKYLTWSFFKQSFLKQILTEGEKYVMTILNVLNFGDQGVYDVVNNLGSLAARFIFLPIEESFYVFFAKVLVRGVKAEDQNQETIKEVKSVLFCLLRLVVLMGLIILIFGYSFSHLLLDIYGGSILSEGSGPTLLRVYCFYVLVIAVNGTTECFVFAAMSEDDVNRYNKVMLGFSMLFLASSYYLTTYLGAVGFILANCLNMGARILHSIQFIQRRFSMPINSRSPLAGLIPEKSVILTLAVSCVICIMSEMNFCCHYGIAYKFLHIMIGAICFIFTIAVIYYKEKEVIGFLNEQYFTKTKVK